MPILKKIKYIIFAAATLTWITIGLYFLFLPRSSDPCGHFDMLVVFQGNVQRTRDAYQLMQRMEVDNFFVPGATRGVLQHHASRYHLPDSIRPLYSEERTHSTFEDALLTGQAIRRSGARRVLLVTSDYHLARSLLLLRLQTSDTGADIFWLGVKSPGNASTRFKKHFNEMIKVWGSLLQLCYFRCTGQHVADAPRLNRCINWLENRILL
ncbi:MAG: hypothetical protein BWK76_16085 [Desulfobulbaceae bacterium A2]|nr:MAG: hypothetical protein BWK76_16085 [Desulfobulbaceae bacterium A2]